VSTLNLAAFGLYLAAFAGIWVGPARRYLLVAAWVLGCLLHAWNLFSPGWAFDFNFFNAIALTAWLTNTLVLIWTLFRPCLHLGLVTLPCAFAAIWIEPTVASSALPDSSIVLAHILISLLAYGALILAGAQALMLLLKEHYLGPSHLNTRASAVLPALDRMDAMLMELIAFGLLLLSIGLAVGGAGLQDPITPATLHKMAFSTLAWVTLVILLWGRWRFGWRGKLAAGITLTAMVFLLFGFLGTKLVLEVILGS